MFEFANLSKFANLSQFRIAFSPKRALKGRIFYANLDARHEKELEFAATLEGASAAAESTAIQNWAQKIRCESVGAKRFAANLID